MKKPKEEIVRIRKELLSKITTSLIYFEYIKDYLIAIIRSCIFPEIYNGDDEAVRILTDNESIHKLTLKARAIYKLYHPADLRGQEVLKILSSKLHELARSRNSLAHSKSLFIALTDEQLEIGPKLESIEIRSTKLGKNGYSSVYKKLTLKEISEFNTEVERLKSAFSSFMFTVGEEGETRDEIFTKELAIAYLQELKLKI